jgi:hypothetical protein
VDRPEGHRFLEDVDVDGTGGLVLVVRYERVVGGPSPTGQDLVAQRLLGDGTRPSGWPAAGRVLCDAPGDQRDSRIIGLGGSLLAAWRDLRVSSDLYAMRLEPDGSPSTGWSPQGLLVHGGTVSQASIRIAPNDIGGALFVWADSRDLATGPDLYAQTVDALGRLDVPRLVTGGLALSEPRPSPTRTPVDLVLESAASGNAHVEILDLSGRLIRRIDLVVVPGRNTVHWDLAGEAGRRVAPGAYHLRVTTPWGSRTRRIIVLG